MDGRTSELDKITDTYLSHKVTRSPSTSFSVGSFVISKSGCLLLTGCALGVFRIAFSMSKSGTEMSYHPVFSSSQVPAYFVQGASRKPWGMICMNVCPYCASPVLYRSWLLLFAPLFSPADSPYPLLLLFRDSLFSPLCRHFGLARGEAVFRAYRTPLVNILSGGNNRWPAHQIRLSIALVYS